MAVKIRGRDYADLMEEMNRLEEAVASGKPRVVAFQARNAMVAWWRIKASQAEKWGEKFEASAIVRCECGKRATRTVADWEDDSVVNEVCDDCYEAAKSARVHLTDEADLQRTPQSMMEESEAPTAPPSLSEEQPYEEFEQLLSPEPEPQSPELAVELAEEPEAPPSASEALAAAAAIAALRPDGFEPCPLCDRATFTNAKQRGDHIRNHNLDSLSCPKCAARIQRWDMGNHLANCSPGVSPEPEPVSGPTAPESPAPEHSSRLVGVSPANPWTCPNCATERVSASSRDVHIKRCPGGTCQWCGLVYVDLGTHRPSCEQRPRGGTNCVHRWELDRPANGITKGKCAFCGAKKEINEAESHVIGRGSR